MVQDKDKTYLQHILDEIDKVEVFLSGVDEKTFTVTDTTEKHYAVVRSLEIIGEAASRISSELRNEHPEIKWGSMIGMRNKIAHEYLDVDYQVVWETACFNLPPLRESIQNLLK